SSSCRKIWSSSCGGSGAPFGAFTLCASGRVLSGRSVDGASDCGRIYLRLLHRLDGVEEVGVAAPARQHRMGGGRLHAVVEGEHARQFARIRGPVAGPGSATEQEDRGHDRLVEAEGTAGHYQPFAARL